MMIEVKVCDGGMGEMEGKDYIKEGKIKEDKNPARYKEYKPETNMQMGIFKQYLKQKNLTDDYMQFLKDKKNKITGKMNSMNGSEESDMEDEE